MNNNISHNLTELTATKVTELLKTKAITAEEALGELLKRHDACDRNINALPTLCVHRAENISRRNINTPPLYGIPVAAKDMTPLKGVRTTYGSKIYKENIPNHTDIILEQVEKSGGAVYAKSNTPEFACGGVTFNSIFGETRNPWNLDYTAGGSSGGAAAAVASGQAWLALGTDFGGSLRIPASFCGVVGLRPTPGVVPHGPISVPYDRYWVEGPIGRNVKDVALLLEAIAIHNPNDPLSYPDTRTYLEAVDKDVPYVKIANVGNLGMGEIDIEVMGAVNKALGKIQSSLGWEVSCAELDLSETRKIFSIRRGLHYIGEFYKLREAHPGLLRKDIVDDLEKGLTNTPKEISYIERSQGKLWERCSQIFNDYDVLATPTVAVPPFKSGPTSITHINGKRLPTYYDWLKLTYSISMLGVPAISIPCGLSKEGLPIGIQLISRPYEEQKLLQIAYSIEQCLDVFKGVFAPWEKTGIQAIAQHLLYSVLLSIFLILQP